MGLFSRTTPFQKKQIIQLTQRFNNNVSIVVNSRIYLSPPDRAMSLSSMVFLVSVATSRVVDCNLGAI